MKPCNPVGWFEIPVTDTERAKKFYEMVFDLELRREDIEGYEMVWFPYLEGQMNASGALMKGMGYVPSGNGGTVIYFAAPNFDEVLGRVEAAGGSIYLPKKDIGKNGYIAWIKDTEGNVVGIHTFKEEK